MGSTNPTAAAASAASHRRVPTSAMSPKQAQAPTEMITTDPGLVRRPDCSMSVASQDPAHGSVGQQLEHLRFPADRGVAGWVFAHGQAVIVADVSTDPRFYRGVDQATGMHTRSIMAAPLRAASGSIGVIEVVNPDPGSMTAGDLEFLQALADDIAVAYEKATLYERLRNEVIGLRQMCRVGGLTLLAVGVLAILGTVVRHLALALPLAELLTAAGTVGGGGALVGGALLLALGRGWALTPALSRK